MEYNDNPDNINNRILSFSSQARNMISNELKNIRKDLDMMK